MVPSLPCHSCPWACLKRAEKLTGSAQSWMGKTQLSHARACLCCTERDLRQGRSREKRKFQLALLGFFFLPCPQRVRSKSECGCSWCVLSAVSAYASLSSPVPTLCFSKLTGSSPTSLAGAAVGGRVSFVGVFLGFLIFLFLIREKAYHGLLLFFAKG